MRVIEPVTIALDKPRQLVLDLAALYLAERELARQTETKRVSLLKLFQGGELGVMETVVLLWAGLQRQEKVKFDQVLEWASQAGLTAVSEAIAEAMRLHIGLGDTQLGGEGAAADPSKSQPISTGPASGPSAGSISG